MALSAESRSVTIPSPGALIVVALGGNAISSPASRGTTDEARAHLALALRGVVTLIERGYRIVLTHGNGPQVGDILQRMELARAHVPALTLDLCGAQSQGQLGYLIEQELRAALRARGITPVPDVATIVTQVVVDPADPKFQRPSKPIGPLLPQARAAALQAAGIPTIEVEPGSWRRVVASPRPLRILQLPAIEMLVRQGVLVVACGGGGVPVVEGTDGTLRGIEGVIDKDLASALLATQLRASMLAILTDVPKVLLDYRTTKALELTRLTAGDARNLLEHDYFPPGSMGPKVQAAVEFVEATGCHAVITSLEHAADLTDPRIGTHILAGARRHDE